MSFSASKSHRLVRGGGKHSAKRRNGDKQKSPVGAELGDQETKKRVKTLGISYLRNSRNTPSPKKQGPMPVGRLALHVMERIRRIALRNQNGGKKKIDLKDIFSKLDEDKSGQLDRKEFYSALKTLGLEITREEFNDVFLVFDPNNTGGIDYDEFVWAFYNRRSFKSTAVSKPPVPVPAPEPKKTPPPPPPPEEPKRPKNMSARGWAAVRKHVRRTSTANAETTVNAGSPVDSGAPSPASSGWSTIQKYVREEEGLSLQSALGSSGLVSVAEEDDAFDESLPLSAPYADDRRSSRRGWDIIRRESFMAKPLMQKISTVLKTPSEEKKKALVPALPPPLETAASPLAKEIRDLAALKNDGILTEKEFLVAKSKVLGVIPSNEDLEGAAKEREMAGIEDEKARIEDEKARLVEEKAELERAKQREIQDQALYDRERQKIEEMERREEERRAVLEEQRHLDELRRREETERKSSEAKVFKEKLDETRKQLRQAFLDKAKMARSIRQLQARVAADEAKLSHARKEEEDKISAIKKHIIINGQETLDDFDNKIDESAVVVHVVKKTASPRKDEKINTSQTRERPESKDPETEIMDVVWENFGPSGRARGEQSPFRVAAKDGQDNRTLAMLECPGGQLSAIGIADIDGKGKRLSLIRLTEEIMLIDEIENIGRVDKMAKLVRARHIVVVNVKGKQVQIVLETKNDMIDMVMPDEESAVRFAQHLHGMIKRDVKS